MNQRITYQVKNYLNTMRRYSKGQFPCQLKVETKGLLRDSVNKQKQIDFVKLTQKLIICCLVCLVIDYRKMNLQDLLEFVKDKFGVDKESSRRLRNIEINQLYFKDEYTKNLEMLSFGEGGTRLSLERGEIPVSGNVPVKIKNQSKIITEPPKSNEIIEILIADDQTLA